MEHWNQKVAKNRGDEWKKNLIIGRLEAQSNPTLLRRKRVEAGISQHDMATKLGVTYSTYGAIEAGNRLVQNERASKIAEILNLELNKAFKKAKLKGRLQAKKG